MSLYFEIIKAMATALLLDNGLYRQHVTGEGHPERPERLEAVASALDKAGLTAKMNRVQPRVAKDDELAMVHSREYIALVRREARIEKATGCAAR